jgi:hypothetical protein
MTSANFSGPRDQLPNAGRNECNMYVFVKTWTQTPMRYATRSDSCHSRSYNKWTCSESYPLVKTFIWKIFWPGGNGRHGAIELRRMMALKTSWVLSLEGLMSKQLRNPILINCHISLRSNSHIKCLCGCYRLFGIFCAHAWKKLQHRSWDLIPLMIPLIT